MKKILPLGMVVAAVMACVGPVQGQCPVTVSAGDDVYLCAPPTPTQLDGNIDGDYLNFFWSPTTGMTGSNTLSPTVNVNTTTSYVLTARAVNSSQNLIQNGDFELGLSGFSSAYNYSPGDLWPEGVYDVLSDPSTAHSNFASCADHTSGSGNMLAVNGAGVPNVEIWCQTVSVMPNTQYVFSAWLTSLVGSSPAQLQFSINGSPLGGIFVASPALCNWQNFYSIWNSGGNSSATICIVNQNTALSGNDFALDDISFAPICVVTDTVTVHVVNVTAVASPVVATIPCEGANITLNGTGSSTGPDVTYEWDTPNGNIVSGQNTLMPVVNAPGTYTLTVSAEFNGTVCTKTASVNVIQAPNPLSAWINTPSPLGCGANTALLIGNSSQPGLSTYSWTATNGGNIVSDPNLKNITVNAPGTYTVLVTNTFNGCTAMAEVEVIQATNIPVAQNQGGLITCSQPSAILTSAGSSTGANISYQWTTPTGTLTGPVNGSTATATAAGAYILAVTNTSNNCTTYDTAFVTANNTPPTVSIGMADTLNCATDTVALQGSASPSGVLYAWTTGMAGVITGPANTSSVTVTSGGTYLLTVTNSANGCTAADTAVVIVDTLSPIAVIQPPAQLTCAQPFTILQNTGTTTGTDVVYHWTTPNGNIVSGSDTLSPLVNAPGTYFFHVLNLRNGCADTASVLVQADPSVLVAVANAPDTLTCAVNAVVLNTNGSSSISGLIYQWTTPNGVIQSGSDTPMPVVTAPGTYTLVITNPANGCTATDFALAHQNIAPPQVQIVLPDTLTCSTPSLVLESQTAPAGLDFQYQWSSTDGNITAGHQLPNAVINAPGQYSLLVTRMENGCTSVASTQVMLEAGTPTALIADPEVINCNRTSVILDATASSSGPGFSLSWSAANGGNFVSPPAGTSVQVNSAGTYHLLVTNTQNGCTATATLGVTVDTLAPPAALEPVPVLTCVQPQQTLQANAGVTGPWTYTWNTLDGQMAGAPSLPAISALAAGSYTVIVIDSINGCTSQNTVAVGANFTAPEFTIGTFPPLTCTTTQIQLPGSATPAGVVFNWTTTNGNISAGSQTPTPQVDAPGTYTANLTNPANGCTNIAQITVIQNIQPPILSIVPPAELNCGAPVAAVEAQNSGLGGDYQYTWSGPGILSGQNTLSIQVDMAGTYSLTAVDTENGCTAQTGTLINADFNPPFVEAGAADTLDCLVSQAALQAQASGSGILSLVWTASNGGVIVQGGNTLSPVISSAGTYTLQVTDPDNGCSGTDAVTIYEDASSPEVIIDQPLQLTCNRTAVTVAATITGPSGLTQQWSTANGQISSGSNTPAAVVSAPGNYQILVTNPANGCTASAEIAVFQDVNAPQVTALATGPLTCDTLQRTLWAMAEAGGAAVSYLWSTADGVLVSGISTATPTVGQPGTYQVMVTNVDNGCTATEQVLQPEDIQPPVFSIPQPDTLNCVRQQATLLPVVTLPTAGFTATWNTLDGQLTTAADVLNAVIGAPGTYTLVVRNTQNGCTAIQSISAVQDTVKPVVQIAPAGQLSCDATQLTLDGTASSNGPGYSTLWTGPAILSGPNSLVPTIGSPGIYSLTITNLENGCQAGSSTVVSIDTTAPPAVIQQPGQLTCTTTSLTLQALNAGGYLYNWTTAAGNILSNPAFPQITINAPGVYGLAVTDPDNGCTSTATATVLQNIQPPHADAGEDAVLHCQQPTVILTAQSNSGGSLQYQWTTLDGHLVSATGMAEVEADAAGVYIVTVTNLVNGCSSSDQLSVTAVQPPHFTLSVDQPDCKNPSGTIIITQVSGDAPPFVYSGNGGQSFSAATTFYDLSPGMHGIAVEDAYGCQADTVIELFSPIYPVVSLPAIQAIELGDSILLTPHLNISPASVTQWQWLPGTGLVCDSCRTTWAMPVTNTRYQLIITDVNGCTASAQIQFLVNKNRRIYAPNAIQPLSNQFNNRFNLYGKGVNKVKWIRIYDRWGDQVGELIEPPINDPDTGWDGHFRGQPVNPAVYVWVAELDFIDGETLILSGDVTVIR